MSVAVPIILIIVVWLFVLAPWLLRSQRPMSHTGEAFDDTRVLFEGDSGSVQGRRRPHLRAAAAATAEQSEQSVQDAEEAVLPAQEAQAQHAQSEAGDAGTGAGRVPGSDSIPTVLGTVEEECEDSSDSKDTAERIEVAETIDGEVLSESFIVSEDTEGAKDAEGTEDSEDAEDDEILIEDEPARVGGEDADAAADSKESVAGADAGDQSEGYDGEVFSTPVVATVAEDAYALDESYTSPVDLMYPGAVDSEVVDSAEAEADADAENSAGAEESQDSSADEAAADVDMSMDLSEEDVAFAQRRLGRGGWDPVADKAVSATRYQRRQRTLLALAAAVVLTVALGIVVGGWTWWLAASAGVLSVVYLVALRSQVRAEQELLRRRVYHLRRARLGVRNGENTAANLPRNLRRPGAVILELDDDSPDFDYLPLHYGDDEHDGFDGPHAGRGPRRDDLAARRVS